MKLLKLLSVPVMVLGMLILATATAYGNHAEISASLNCTSATKVCLDLTVSTESFPNEGRQITVTLLGHKRGDADADKFSAIGQSQTVTLKNGLDNEKVPVCFDNVTTTDFDFFKLDIKVVGNEFTLNKENQTEVKLGPFANNCPTPAPPPPAQTSPSASASAATTTSTTLAGTGGFDFRYPLVGLTVLVAGLALLLVSASRGRSSTK